MRNLLYTLCFILWQGKSTLASTEKTLFQKTSYRTCTLYTIISVPVPGGNAIPEKTICVDYTLKRSLPSQDPLRIDLHGDLNLFLKGGYESGKTTLSIPEELISWNNDVNVDEPRASSIRVETKPSSRGVIYSGTFHTLILRIADGGGGSFTHSTTDIGNKFFGTGSVREKFKNCSKDKAILEPAQGSVLSNGVYDVSVTNTIATGDDCLSTGAEIAAASVINGDIDDYEYLMIICPSTVDFQGASALSYLNGYASVYDDAYVSSPSILAHGIGHNFNFRNSGKGTDPYGDPIDTMGAYSGSGGGEKICFNAAKSFQSNWYTNGLTKPTRSAYNGYIADVNSWYSSQIKMQHVAVQVIGSGEETLYFMLHRSEGITSDTIASDAADYVNKVNIVRQFNNDNFGYGRQSWHVKSLASGETYSQTNWGNSDKTLKITVCSIDEGSPVQAKVIVYVEGLTMERCDSSPTSSPTDLQTIAPTRMPSFSTGTGSPVPAPTAAPVQTAAPAPTCAPSTKACIDSIAPLKIKGEDKYCSWVGSKPRRCDKPRFASHCPVTCNACDKYKCADSLALFAFPNGSKKKCDFVKIKLFKIEKRCSRNRIKSACRETCGYCETLCD